MVTAGSVATCSCTPVDADRLLASVPLPESDALRRELASDAADALVLVIDTTICAATWGEDVTETVGAETPALASARPSAASGPVLPPEATPELMPAETAFAADGFAPRPVTSNGTVSVVASSPRRCAVRSLRVVRSTVVPTSTCFVVTPSCCDHPLTKPSLPCVSKSLFDTPSIPSSADTLDSTVTVTVRGSTPELAATWFATSSRPD